MNQNENDKNVIDVFLDKYGELNENAPRKVRIYQRPSKGKCILYFGMAVAILFCMLFVVGIHLRLSYFLFLLGDIAVGAFFGYNLFSDQGIGIPTYIKKYKDEDDIER